MLRHKVAHLLVGLAFSLSGGCLANDEGLPDDVGSTEQASTMGDAANWGWTCDPDSYGTGDGCDCGCGITDPDCGGAGCTASGCVATGCEFCYNADGTFDCDDDGISGSEPSSGLFAASMSSTTPLAWTQLAGSSADPKGVCKNACGAGCDSCNPNEKIDYGGNCYIGQICPSHEICQNHDQCYANCAGGDTAHIGPEGGDEIEYCYGCLLGQIPCTDAERSACQCRHTQDNHFATGAEVKVDIKWYPDKTVSMDFSDFTPLPAIPLGILSTAGSWALDRRIFRSLVQHFAPGGFKGWLADKFIRRIKWVKLTGTTIDGANWFVQPGDGAWYHLKKPYICGYLSVCTDYFSSYDASCDRQAVQSVDTTSADTIINDVMLTQGAGSINQYFGQAETFLHEGPCHCSDGVQNNGEEGVDCGGPCGNACTCTSTGCPSSGCGDVYDNCGNYCGYYTNGCNSATYCYDADWNGVDCSYGCGCTYCYDANWNGVACPSTCSGSCYGYCGDGKCGLYEDSYNCPSDCGGGGGGGDSCYGNCGGSAGSCWCDSACTNYGDCCSDYDYYCGGGGGKEPIEPY